MIPKIVYLMRGLPSCGKSHTARELAGTEGAVCETDSFFMTEVGDDPESYDYDKTRIGEARAWNFDNFTRALSEGRGPIVVDRGNGLSLDTQAYARAAIDGGYELSLAEPGSAWWQEIRVLLKYKRYNRPVLYEWSEALSILSRATHRVSASNIRRRMSQWKHDLTVEEILNFDPEAFERVRAARVSSARHEKKRRQRRAAATRRSEIGTGAGDLESLTVGLSAVSAAGRKIRQVQREAARTGPDLAPGEMLIFDEQSGGFGLAHDDAGASDWGYRPDDGDIDIDDDGADDFIFIDRAAPPDRDP